MVSGGVVSGESSEGVSVTTHHSPLHHSPSHLVILSRTRSTPVGTTATPTDWKQSLEQKAVNTIRTLSMDAVQAANSGHPEYRWTSGVETTTGPLGQGVATSVGMAMAGKWQAAYFNRPGFELFHYDVYALAGDGCMMEGISGEAASLAGHLKLNNLCWIYDNNKITIEGSTDLAFSDDVATRFIGYGWNVTRVGDANDLAMLGRAFETAKATPDRPTLIIVDSHIGYGAPHKQDTHAAHGEPLGEEEIRLGKRFYGWPEEEKFLVPEGVRERFAAGIGARGARLRAEWTGLFESYKTSHSALGDDLDRMQHRRLP